jgi:hypothetical protein
MNNSLIVLGRKAGFNTALRHFKSVNEFAGDVSRGVNLADALNVALEDGRVHRNQVNLALNALLVDKFDYAFQSHNLNTTLEAVDSVCERLAEWTKIQLVLVFHHPQAGIFAINPKNPDSWEPALPLLEDELVVLYAGPVAGQDVPEGVLKNAVKDFFSVLYGRNVKLKKEYVGPPSLATRTPVPKPQAAPAETAAPQESPSAQSGGEARPAAPPSATGKRRITPRYSVVVTNELFHNGNVEAWKRIIDSYKAKYNGLDVLIWYDNERINDINALFKWGKVKHGTPIMVSVVGDDIKAVAKLQRYLYEGASPRFEAFLKGSVDRVLDLF